MDLTYLATYKEEMSYFWDTPHDSTQAWVHKINSSPWPQNVVMKYLSKNLQSLSK